MYAMHDIMVVGFDVAFIAMATWSLASANLYSIIEYGRTVALPMAASYTHQMP